MLTAEQNRLLTQTDPGTPGGELLRRYWQPAALSEELGADPIPLRLLGEELVLFRGANGTPALMEAHCPHRLADLSFGRLENGNLRCTYHGWLFAADGRCLAQPGEPPESTYKDRVRIAAYPCREVNGVILTYMGPAEPPPLPALPFLLAPPDAAFVTKAKHDCNYLQGNEGNLDPQHLSFLHRTFAPADAHQLDVERLIGADVAPKIEVDETPYGLRVYAIRTLPDTRLYVRITNFIMPNCSAFQGAPPINPAVQRIDENQTYQMHWHVPIDDESHWKYQFYVRLDGPVDKAWIAQQQTGEMDRPYDRKRRRENRYLLDRSEQRTRTFAGIGFNFQDHDRYAVESQGVVVDRTREHLAATDKAIAAMRKQLLEAVADVSAGRAPRPLTGDPDPFAEFVVLGQEVPADTDVRAFWKDRVTATR